ncbi:MAG TPA: RNA polymerase subunit alpha domain protein, partial [Planctomycetaceae bacterium]|nr:RNA polymerase subunit alpha domain protein [Planctomycetaceae bacterium]
MSQVVEVDLRQIVLTNSTFGPNEIHQIVNSISTEYSNFRSLRDAVGEMQQQAERTPAASARLGVCQYLLGRYSDSVQTLTNADGGALTHFYLGKAYLALDKYSEALTAYESAERAGYNRDDVALAQAEAKRYTGDIQGALTLLDSLSGAVEQTSEYLYQRSATISAMGGNSTEVVALLERAVEADDTHAGALFGLALENDRYGNDEYARQLYERAAAQFPVHVGTLLNLGLLYEDLEHFERSKQCYQRVLEVYPDHPRARLFFKDADASRDMYYDEDARRRQERMTQ